MERTWLIFAGVYGMLGVGAGAFGAHALKTRLSADMLAVFETGSRYCLVHAVVLLGVAAYSALRPSAALRRSGWFFVVGIAIFSGTLWILALSGQRWLGAITPIGGTSLILGWFSLMMAGISQEKK